MKNETSLSLLRRIALEPLPVILTDDRDFERVSLLVQAGLLQATMQIVAGPMVGFPVVGVVVREITRLGWLVLQSKSANAA